MSKAEDKLEGLQPLLTSMSNEQLLEFIRSVRTDRKIPQHQVKAKAKKKVKAKSDLSELLAKIDPKILKKILEERTAK